MWVNHVVMCNQIWNLWIHPLCTFKICGSMFYNDDEFFVNIKYNDHLQFYINTTHLFLIFLNYGWFDLPLIMRFNRCSCIINRHQVMKKINRNPFETIFFNANTSHSICRFLFWFSFFFWPCLPRLGYFI